MGVGNRESGIGNRESGGMKGRGDGLSHLQVVKRGSGEAGEREGGRGRGRVESFTAGRVLKTTLRIDGILPSFGLDLKLRFGSYILIPILH